MTDGDEIVRRAASAFNMADPDAFAALAHPDFLFAPLLTRSADGQPYRGREGARQYVLDAHAWATTRLEVGTVADHGDVLVSHCTLSMTVDGRTSSFPVVYVARVRDGLVAEMATLADVSEAAVTLGIETPPPAGPPLHLELPAVPESVPAFRLAVRVFARSRGFEDTQPMALAVTEATTNAVLHAYADAPEPGPIALTGRDETGGILVSVADEGHGLRPRAGSPGMGLGLPIMQSAAAEVSFRGPPQRPAGTEVRLRFAR